VGVESTNSSQILIKPSVENMSVKPKDDEYDYLFKGTSVIYSN